MRARTWSLAAVIGAIAGLAAAVPMTIVDWQANPAGLFHGPEGTDWAIVAETAFSWFWPAALIAFFATAIIHGWMFRERPGA